MRKIALVLLFTAAGTGIVSGSAHAAQDATKKDQPKHVVANGESLSTVATDNQLPNWRPIWNANADLQNPDQITPGQTLAIPKPTDQTADRPLPAGYDEPNAQPTVQPQAQATAPTPSVSYQPAHSSYVGGGGGGDLAARVRARESGGNYATNTGNGYSGAYQYDDGTWGGYGGYAHAYQAPAAIQDAKFQQTYAARGCSPWPNTCR